MRHKVRLGPRRYAFFCPFTRLHLTYPDHPEGEVDDSADLTYIMAAIRSGSLIDVNGTLTSRVASPTSRDRTAPESPVEQDRLPDDRRAAEPRGQERSGDVPAPLADGESLAESEPDGSESQDESSETQPVRSPRRRRRR